MAVVSSESKLIESLWSEELGDSERIIWTGKPGLLSAILECKQSLSIIGFYLAALYVHETSELDNPFVLLFVGIGWIFALVFAVRIIWAVMRAARTVYAVTDYRIIMLTSVVRRSIRSYAAANFGEMSWVARGNDRGTIVLGPMPKTSVPSFRDLIPSVPGRMRDVRGLRDAVRAIERIQMSDRRR